MDNKIADKLKLCGREDLIGFISLFSDNVIQRNIGRILIDKDIKSFIDGKVDGSRLCDDLVEEELWYIASGSQEIEDILNLYKKVWNNEYASIYSGISRTLASLIDYYGYKEGLVERALLEEFYNYMKSARVFEIQQGFTEYSIKQRSMIRKIFIKRMLVRIVVIIAMLALAIENRVAGYTMLSLVLFNKIYRYMKSEARTLSEITLLERMELRCARYRAIIGNIQAICKFDDNLFIRFYKEGGRAVVLRIRSRCYMDIYSVEAIRNGRFTSFYKRLLHTNRIIPDGEGIIGKVKWCISCIKEAYNRACIMVVELCNRDKIRIRIRYDINFVGHYTELEVVKYKRKEA